MKDDVRLRCLCVKIKHVDLQKSLFYGVVIHMNESAKQQACLKFAKLENAQVSFICERGVTYRYLGTKNEHIKKPDANMSRSGQIL